MSKLKITLFLILSGLIFPAFGSALVEPTFAINIYDFFQRIFRILLTISIPLAVIVIIWAAFIFLTSGGEPEKTGRAKKVLIYGLIGFIIILFANGIVAVLGNILGVKVPDLEKLPQVKKGTPTETSLFGISPARGEGVSKPEKGEKFPPPPPQASEKSSFQLIPQVFATDEEEVPPPIEEKFITVVSPTAETQIKQGETYPIRWQSSGIEKIAIILYRGTSLKGVIARNLPSGGYENPVSVFYWTLPEDFEIGNNYYLALYQYPWQEGNTVSYSGRFSIAKEKEGDKYLKLTSPEGGETWKVNGTYPIRWQLKGVEKIDILFRPAVYESGWYETEKGQSVQMLTDATPILIASEIPADSGQYQWTIPPYSYLNSHGYVVMLRDSACNCGLKQECSCQARDENKYPFYIALEFFKGHCNSEGTIVRGGIDTANCCLGLKPISVTKSPIYWEEARYSCSSVPNQYICAACGNSVCGMGEDKCNCPEDCVGENGKSIKVISPNGREFLEQDTVHKIKWEATENINYVNIFRVYYGWNLIKKWGIDIGNDLACSGPGGLVEAARRKGDNIFDAVKSILPPKVWDCFGIAFAVIAENVPAAHGEYSWKVGEEEKIGQLSYAGPSFSLENNAGFDRILIEDSGSEVFDYSDEAFKILRPIKLSSCDQDCKKLGYLKGSCGLQEDPMSCSLRSEIFSKTYAESNPPMPEEVSKRRGEPGSLMENWKVEDISMDCVQKAQSRCSYIYGDVDHYLYNLTRGDYCWCFIKSPWIEITSFPKRMAPGNTYEITWISSGIDKVDIIWFKFNPPVQIIEPIGPSEITIFEPITIAAGVPAALGKYSFSIPSDAVSNFGHRIRIVNSSSTSPRQNFDYDEESFTVGASPKPSRVTCDSKCKELGYKGGTCKVSTNISRSRGDTYMGIGMGIEGSAMGMPLAGAKDIGQTEDCNNNIVLSGPRGGAGTYATGGAGAGAVGGAGALTIGKLNIKQTCYCFEKIGEPAGIKMEEGVLQKLLELWKSFKELLPPKIRIRF